jgi:hypothetical protein
MPNTAMKALDGMLAEGVSAGEVMSKLESAGYDIKPPEGDMSYGEEEPAAVLAIGMGAPMKDMEDMEDEKEEKDEDEDKEDGNPKNKRMGAAKRAMEKHGY